MYFITDENLAKLLDELRADYDVFVPTKKDDKRFYKKYDESTENVVIGEVRAFEPLKSFFFGARERVSEDFKPDIPASGQRPFAIVGVKACDLKGLKIHDHVLKNHDYQDPFYIKKRVENLIISADCTSTIDTCFCTAFDVKPYPQGDFDINLSQIGKGFAVDLGSEKGRQVLEAHSSLFGEADENAKKVMKDRRAKMTSEVEKNVKENDIPGQDAYKGAVEKNYGSKLWQDEAKNCVECAACNTVCPTCHCFLLYDQKNEKKMMRLRTWDSCMVKDFARVAGGANPRPKLWERLRNRFEKKFDFFPKVADIYACTGCGRCISACPAKIDIRNVLKKLVKGA